MDSCVNHDKYVLLLLIIFSITTIQSSCQAFDHEASQLRGEARAKGSMLAELPAPDTTILVKECGDEIQATDPIRTWLIVQLSRFAFDGAANFGKKYPFYRIYVARSQIHERFNWYFVGNLVCYSRATYMTTVKQCYDCLAFIAQKFSSNLCEGSGSDAQGSPTIVRSGTCLVRDCYLKYTSYSMSDAPPGYCPAN